MGGAQGVMMCALPGKREGIMCDATASAGLLVGDNALMEIRKWGNGGGDKS